MTEPSMRKSQPQPTANTQEKLATFLGSLAKPAPAITDPIERQQVRFLATILLLIASLTGVRLIVGLLGGTAQAAPTALFLTVVWTILLFIAYGISRSRRYPLAPFIALTTLVTLVYTTYFTQPAYAESTLLWLIPIVIFAGTILSTRDTLIFTVSNILLLILLPLLVPDLAVDQISFPLSLLTVTSILIVVFNQYRNTLAAANSQELAAANKELQTVSEKMEVRVEDRTRELALAFEVGRIISQILEIDSLLAQAVEIINDRFDLYHTQIYLIQEDFLELRAGSGGAGQQLLSEGHTLPLDHHSINGSAAITKKSLIVGDTSESKLFKPNPTLPETRSELSVPLLVQDQVVGVLDMQMSQTYPFSEENLPAFEVLAGQLAIAIQNAKLLNEMEEGTRFLDSVVENLPLMLFVKDAKDLRFVRWNKAAEEITGFPTKEILGSNDYDLFPVEEADFFTSKDRRVLEGTTNILIPEEPIQTADEEIRILQTTKTPILDAKGRPRYLLGISQDITEQKEIEEQLAERIKQLNMFNDLGLKANETLDLTEFLEWTCISLPDLMRKPEACRAAISLDGRVYGTAAVLDSETHLETEIQIRRKVIGHIHVAYTKEEMQFNAEESALLRSISLRVSSYIENLRLVAQLQGQAEDLQKVAEISTAVATIGNPYQLVQAVARLTQTQFNLYQTAVFTLEENNLILSGAHGPMGQKDIEQSPQISTRTQKSIVAQAARNKEAILINDVATSADYMPHPLLPKTRSEIAVPLQVGERLLGVLDFHSDETNTFSQKDLHIFNTLALQVAISLQNAYQYEETQSALEKLNSLQRVITSESWQAFMNAPHRPVQGYVSSRQVLKPLAPPANNHETDLSQSIESPDLDLNEEDLAFVTPVQLRGTTIGKIGVRSQADAPISEETQALIMAISQQVAEALERARLFAETEIARSQTDQLYAGSERVVRATTIDEILAAIVESTRVQELDRAALLFFDQIWGQVRPQTMSVAAVWEKSEQLSLTPPGTIIELSAYGMLTQLTRWEPVVIHNVHTDPRVDEATLAWFEQTLGMTSAVIIPLLVGEQWFGIFIAQAAAAVNLSQEDVRQISSLVDQAATVAQTQRLYEETEARAQQEQILREVSERVYGAMDAESVLRTAVQEVGRVLGLEAFVYLDEEELAPPADSEAEPEAPAPEITYE